jgi:hypothetical protein
VLWLVSLQDERSMHSASFQRYRRAGALGVSLVLWSASLSAVTFSVVSNQNFDDWDPGDGVCDPFPPPDPGPCTLRAALQESAALAGADLIQFALPPEQLLIPVNGNSGGMINQPLLAVGPVLIDGGSQPGFSGTPMVELNFQGGGLIPGLAIVGDDVEVRHLSIAGFPLEGISVFGHRATLMSCWVGVRRDALSALANLRGIVASGDDLRVTDSVVSGNLTGGIIVTAEAADAIVEGSYVGLLPDGNSMLGNGPGGEGILDLGVGSRIGPDNVLAGNGSAGVRLQGSQSSVFGNAIGTNAAGLQARPNGVAGVLVDGALDVSIGGDNLISGNNGRGVLIRGSSQIRVQGNLIGSDVSGNAPLGNARDGIRVQRLDSTPSSEILIGGIGPLGISAGNVIVANGQIDGGHGISCLEATSGLQIWGNQIGVAANGAGALGNLGHGVLLDTCSGADVGPTPLFAGAPPNLMAYNGLDGLAVVGASATGNLFTGNRIHDNGGLAIDLDNDGVTANDPGDGDGGANRRSNFPLLQDLQGGILSGSLDALANRAYAVEIYANESCDASGHGEAQTPVTAISLTTNAQGHADFSVPVGLLAENFSALAIDLVTGDSSELGPCLVEAGGALGNRVFADRNGDGLQGFDEPGIAGVIVRLLDSAGSPLVSTLTAADGRYRFAGVASGDYRIAFEAMPGHEFSPPDVGGDDRIDSDVIDAQGRTELFSYVGGSVDLTRDAGLMHELFADGFE